MNATPESHALLSLPKGGGALSGMGEKFSPDLHTGTGNFTVPFALLPGRNGFQPALSLAYSTGNGNGLFGLGWSLSIPGITRKTSKGIPRYRDRAAPSERDTFLLSGAEDLVFVGRVNDEAGVAVDRYRPRTEGLFAEVFRYKDDARGRDYWRVRTKDGLVSFYGTNPDPSAHPRYATAPSADPAVVARPGRAADIFDWRLTLTLDPFGNRIEYLYDVDTGSGHGHDWKQPLLAQIRYGDYGEPASPRFLITATFQYEERPDPFSNYRASFEIRTSRRCRAILIETDADRRRPVRRYEFAYKQASLNAMSLLRAIDVVGFDDVGAESRELPPLEFDYSDFDPQNRNRRDFYPLQGDHLPTAALNNTSYELVDLFGSGLPDFLEVGGTGVRYWRNRGGGRFAVPREMDDAPPELLAATGVQLIDANGDGRTDLLVTRQDVNGYYPLKFGGLWDRRSFQRYQYAPSFDLEDPEVRIVDLTGDGVSDAIRSGTRLECFFNDAEEGWRPHSTYWAERGSLDSFPNVNFSDPRVKFADLSGDGMQDVVLVHDGNIEYWPNHGYGKWGTRLHMRNSPRFPLNYDPRRLLIGDLNGDGLADIVYVEDHAISLWINQSGNAWSEEIRIPGTPPVSDIDLLRLTDLLGSGISGILWTKNARTASDDHYFFLDLTGGTKPYLLNEVKNNIGAVTKIAYAPSIKFYLEDEKRRQTRWRTTLSFPVQVVSHIEVFDELSGGKLATEYRYHHGYWDGVEREFRGFACVEQLSTESFERYREPGLHGPGVLFEQVDREHFSAPTLTKTWFHQGPVGDDTTNWQEMDWRAEFWSGDAQQLDHVESTNRMLAGLREQYAALTSRERRTIQRDALRALRGNVIRTELYARDGTARADRPYTVTEYLYSVREESAPTGPSDRRRIFFSHPLAQRSTQWERGDDPMTNLAYTRDYDGFGNVLTSIHVACPRGWRHLDDDVRASYLATVAMTEFAAPATDVVYIHDRVARAAAYEILNPEIQDTAPGAPPNPGRTVADLLALAQDARNLRIISETISFYDDDAALTGKGEFVGAPFRVLERYGTVTRSESLVLTGDIVNAAYGGQAPPYLQPGTPGTSGPPFAASADYPAAFVQQLPSLAGYVHRPSGDGFGGGYYVASERRRFDFHGTGTVRGLVLASMDPIGTLSLLEYDQPYAMLPIAVTDGVNLSVHASYNYRVLQPESMIDANGNRSNASYSPIGLVTATWTRGKATESEGDILRPSVRLEYDFLAYLRGKQQNPPRLHPIYVRTRRWLRHESDPDDRGETIETRDYSDGFGRLIQTRTQGERVRFGNAIFGGGDTLLPPRQSDGPGGIVQGVDNNDPENPNVVVSGWQRYDNRGRVIQKFEPFFAVGWAFAPPRDGQAPGQRDLGASVTIFYDPRGHLIRTLNPDGSEQRIVYGVPQSLDDPTDPAAIVSTPWEVYTYDADDNAGRTHAAASERYRHHWNTPTSIEVDALGRTIAAVVRNRAEAASGAVPLPAIDQYRTRSTYDIQGNLLKLIDPLNRVAFAYTYDLARKALRIANIDAGVTSIVFDARGQEMDRIDAKGAKVLRCYDRLGRPDRMWARNATGDAMTLREQTFYGDAGDPAQPANDRVQARASNLLGKVARQLDEAGEIAFVSNDFKGNLRDKVRRVIADAPLVAAFDAPGGSARAFAVDWDNAPPLSGAYETSYAYDALDRVTAMRYPRDVDGVRKTLVPTYNAAGALERIALDGDVIVDRIAYNAKGQRVLIAYGNGLMTRYAADPVMSRLTRLRTEQFVSVSATATSTPAYRPQGTPLQDYEYAYDLTGSIVRVTEQVPGCGVRNNPRACEHPQLQALLAAGDALVRTFDYDPLYRLTRATGREGDSLLPGPRPWADVADPGFEGFDWGGTAGTPSPDTARDATRFYEETYSYDAAGNMLTLAHGTWTRRFGISGFTPQAWAQESRTHLDPSNAWTSTSSNRLTHVGDDQPNAPQTHFFDATGNLIRENTERHFAWNALDRMAAFANRTAGANASATVEACYLYDSMGLRTKKLVRKGVSIEVTIYIDDIFEHRIFGAQQNSTLHVIDDETRLAAVRMGPAFQGDAGPAVQYHLGDHLRSSHIVVGGSDASERAFINREEYFPFGETSFGSFGRKRYRFNGRERDEESGLAYHGARYYAAYFARWLSCDPMAPADGLNAYVYAHEDPVNYMDSSGTQAEQQQPNLQTTWTYTETVNETCAGTVDSCQPVSVTRTLTRTIHNVDTGETQVDSLSVTEEIEHTVPVAPLEFGGREMPEEPEVEDSTFAILKAAIEKVPEMMSKTSEERAQEINKAFLHSQPAEEAAKNTRIVMGTSQAVGALVSMAAMAGLATLKTGPPDTHIVYGGFKRPTGQPGYVGRASGTGTAEEVLAARIQKGHRILKGNPDVEGRVLMKLPTKGAAKGAEGAWHDYLKPPQGKGDWLNSLKSPPLGKSPGRLSKSFGRLEEYSQALKSGDVRFSCPAADRIFQGLIQRGAFH